MPRVLNNTTKILLKEICEILEVGITVHMVNLSKDLWYVVESVGEN